MTRIVVNRCFGGFGLSTEAVKWLIAHKSELIRTRSFSEYYGSKKLDEYERQNWKSVGDGFYTTQHECILYDEKCTTVWSLNYDLKRTHPDLIAVVEALGEGVNGQFAKLEIVEIPNGIEWEINDYDGSETIEEKHRSW